MAKQLSTAGFSVVVLEQGGWGKYGREQEYTKDEWLNGNPAPDGSAHERSVAAARTRSAARTRRRRGPARTLRLRRRRRHGHLRRQQLAPLAVGVQREEPRRRDRRHAASRTGRSPTTSSSRTTRRPNGRWASRACASTRRLSRRCPRIIRCRPCRSRPPARCSRSRAKKLGLTVVPGPLAIITQPYMGRTGCVNCGMCSGFGCHVRRAIELGGHRCCRSPSRPATARSGRIATCARSRSTRSGRVTGVDLLRRGQARALPESEGGGAVRERLGVGASAAAVEVGDVSRRARELERRRRQISDDRQRRERERALRAPLNDYKGVDLRRGHRRLRAVRSEARLLRRRAA